jgi:hypothetical protein
MIHLQEDWKIDLTDTSDAIWPILTLNKSTGQEKALLGRSGANLRYGDANKVMYEAVY